MTGYMAIILYFLLDLWNWHIACCWFI